MPDGYDIAKKAPAKKNTKKWCRGKVGVEHVLEIRKDRYFQSLHQHNDKGHWGHCGWKARWTGWHTGWDHTNPRYMCFHEEYCVNCGKIVRTNLNPQECPEFKTFVPGSLLPRA